MTNNPSDQNPFAKVIAKAWSDEAYKQRLIDDPRTVLTEAGIDVPENREIRVFENTDSVANIVLPTAPDEGEISEEALNNVSGGTMSGNSMCVGGCASL
jgi:hypothetical protein